MFHDQSSIAFEPLLEAALLAWEQAPHLCTDGCTAYHRTWSLTRLLGADSKAPVGAPFFTQGMAHLAELDAPRILMSGGADTGLTALAIACMGEAAARAQFVYVDRCATPVAQNRLMASHVPVDLEAVQSNILALDMAPFDAILAHSFVSFLPSALRPDLFAVWAKHLRPGGRLLFSNSVAPIPGAKRKPKDPERLAERAVRLRAAAAERGLLEGDLDVFETLMRDDPMLKNPLEHSTETEYREMIAQAGLALELMVFDPDRSTTGPLTILARADRNMRVGFQARKP